MVRAVQNGRAGSAQSSQRRGRSIARGKSKYRGSAEPGAAFSYHSNSNDGFVYEWVRSSATSRGDASTCDSKVYRAQGRGEPIGKMKSAAVKLRPGDMI